MALSARAFALPDNKEWYPCPLTHAKSLEPVCNLCTLDGPSRRELLGTVLVQAAGLVDLLTSSTKWDTEVDLSKLAQSEVLMPSQALVCIIFDELIWMEEKRMHSSPLHTTVRASTPAKWSGLQLQYLGSCLFSLSAKRSTRMAGNSTWKSWNISRDSLQLLLSRNILLWWSAKMFYFPRRNCAVILLLWNNTYSQISRVTTRHHNNLVDPILEISETAAMLSITMRIL